MKYIAVLTVLRDVTPVEQIKLADMLSGIAADIRKGEDKAGATIRISVAEGRLGVLS